MSEALHVRPLFQSELLRIEDVRCRPHHGECGAEEFSSAPSLAIVRGGIFRKHRGRESILADANQVVFFNAGESYCVSHPVDGGDDCTAITFAPALVREAMAGRSRTRGEPETVPFPVLAAYLPPSAALAAQTVRRRVALGMNDPLECDALALEILASAVRSMVNAGGESVRRQRDDTDRAHRQLADDVRMLLSARFRDEVSLADVSRAVHSSPFHLARVFRRATGTPIHRYLVRLRLRRALDRLVQGYSDLTELALDVGFASHSHFTDAFRAEFGMPPSTFRRGLTRRAFREMSKILEA